MIHCFKNNGYNIIMDVNSGAVHVADDVLYDAVGLWEEFDKDALIEKLSEKYDSKDAEEACREIEKLVEDEVLFTPDEYEENITSFIKGKAPVVKALCLHVAHSCNLSCEYCFAGEGRYHGDAGLMSFETGKAALDFLVANSGFRTNLEVDFFGGEPLLDFEVIKQLVAYGRSIEKEHNKHFRFTLTTNGVRLDDEVLDFANLNMHNLVLSIDGRKEVHDRMRPFRDGSGSYDMVLPKFQKAAESRHQKDYYVRGTYTHYNLDFSKDVLHLADMGFEQISVEPVVADPKEAYAIKEEDLPVLFEEYDRLACEMVKRKKENRGFNFFHFMIDLEGGPCVYKRLTGCGSGTEYLAVTPWGDLYPCHQFVGNEKFRMGNVFEGITQRNLQEKFANVNVYSREKCRTCFVRYYCSGGCAANSYNATGDVNGTYDIGCELQKKRIECAIMIKACEAMDMA